MLESAVGSAFSCSVLIRVCLLIPFVSSLDHVCYVAFFYSGAVRFVLLRLRTFLALCFSIYRLHVTLRKYDFCFIMSYPPNFLLTPSPSQPSRLGDNLVLRNISGGIMRGWPRSAQRDARRSYSMNSINYSKNVSHFLHHVPFQIYCHVLPHQKIGPSLISIKTHSYIGSESSLVGILPLLGMLPMRRIAAETPVE